MASKNLLHWYPMRQTNRFLFHGWITYCYGAYARTGQWPFNTVTAEKGEGF